MFHFMRLLTPILSVRAGMVRASADLEPVLQQGTSQPLGLWAGGPSCSEQVEKGGLVAEALDLGHVEHLGLRLDPVRRDRYAAGGRLVPERTVRPGVVVGVEEVGQRGGSLVVAGVGADVEPLLLHGAVEALHLAIGPGRVWAGVLVDRPGPGEGVIEDARSVRRAVVREAAADRGDAVLAVEQHRTEPERGRGGSPLVRVDFGVGLGGCGRPLPRG